MDIGRRRHNKDELLHLKMDFGRRRHNKGELFAFNFGKAYKIKLKHVLSNVQVKNKHDFFP